jgi:hypothetical protein
MDVLVEILALLEPLASPVTLGLTRDDGKPRLPVVTAGGASAIGNTPAAAAARVLAILLDGFPAPESSPPAEDRSNGHELAPEPGIPAKNGWGRETEQPREQRPGKIKHEQLSRIREMMNTHSAREIAEELGLPLSTIGYHATKMRKEAGTAKGGNGFPRGDDAV